MTDSKTADLDWELSEDYYQTDDAKKELKLEDFVEHENEDSNTVSASNHDLLQKTIQEVGQVMFLASQGEPIKKIAEMLNLDEQYVYDIQVTAQGFHEDGQIAVAHLMMMGS